MHFEGNFEVLRHLVSRKSLRGGSGHTNTRLGLLILSGVMRGVVGGGYVTALQDYGLTDAFDVVVGISTGAPTGAYFLAGQARLGTTLYCQECTTPEFINVWRMFRGGPLVDIEYLARAFRGYVSHKTLDQDAVRHSRSGFYAGVTSALTGEGKFIDAKQMDMVDAIRASIAMPALSHVRVQIEGVPYVDGGIALPLPASEMIRRFDLTHLLIIANYPNKNRGSGLESLLMSIIARKFSREFHAMVASRASRWVDELLYLRLQHQCHVGILWSDNSVGRFTRDSAVLASAATRSEEYLSRLLREAET